MNRIQKFGIMSLLCIGSCTYGRLSQPKTEYGIILNVRRNQQKELVLESYKASQYIKHSGGASLIPISGDLEKGLEFDDYNSGLKVIIDNR